MKITVESTPEFHTIDGLLVRAWQGTTASGIGVTAYVRALGVRRDEDATEFEREFFELAAQKSRVDDEQALRFQHVDDMNLTSETEAAGKLIVRISKAIPEGAEGHVVLTAITGLLREAIVSAARVSNTPYDVAVRTALDMLQEPVDPSEGGMVGFRFGRPS